METNINELTEYQKGFWNCFCKLSFSFSIYENKRQNLIAERNLLLDLNIPADEIKAAISTIEMDSYFKTFLSNYLKTKYEQ
jgi:hypothetical protein